MSPDYAEMSQAVVDGDRARASELAQTVIASGADVLAAVEQGFAGGIRKVGELWEEGEYFLPELVQGAEAMKAAMEILGPALRSGSSEMESRGKIVIGTVEGDMHDIGKSLVATLLSANGFEVHDLGSNITIDAFLEKAREVGAHIIGASALLTTTMSAQRRLVEAVHLASWGRSELRPKVMVGGAPTSPEWAAEIGASHAENALAAVTTAMEILGR